MIIKAQEVYKFSNIEDSIKNRQGLVAVGGELSSFMLLSAYSQGVFPWFNKDEPICWWYISPRMVLYPEKLKVSKSLLKKIRNSRYIITVNNDFVKVIHNCAETKRKNQNGTWITKSIKDAYINLNKLGYSLSFEYYEIEENNKILLGGLYGVKLGNIFFGESMFSKKTDASKIAFVHAVKFLQSLNVKLIDCQIYTDYLASFGAYEIPKEKFDEYLKNEVDLSISNKLKNKIIYDNLKK